MAEDDDDTPEVIEVDRDIACEIYSASYRRLAGAPAPRMYLTLAFDAVSYSSLCAIVGANLKGQAVVHFANIQAPLPDAPEDPKPARDDTRPPLFTTGSGEPILPHIFKGQAEDELKCTYCSLGEPAEIHILPHPFESTTRDNQCGRCGRPETHDIHLTDEQRAARDGMGSRRPRSGGG